MSYRAWIRPVAVIVAMAMLWHGAGFVVDHDESEVAPQVNAPRASPIISAAVGSLFNQDSEAPALWAVVPVRIDYGRGGSRANVVVANHSPVSAFVLSVRSPRAPPLR